MKSKIKNTMLAVIALAGLTIGHSAFAAPMPTGCLTPDGKPAICNTGVGNTLPVLALGAIILSVSDSMHPQACDNEPQRKVTEAGKGYSFTVAGCEYEAHKSKYTIVK